MKKKPCIFCMDDYAFYYHAHEYHQGDRQIGPYCPHCSWIVLRIREIAHDASGHGVGEPRKEAQNLKDIRRIAQGFKRIAQRRQERTSARLAIQSL